MSGNLCLDAQWQFGQSITMRGEIRWNHNGRYVTLYDTYAAILEILGQSTTMLTGSTNDLQLVEGVPDCGMPQCPSSIASK